jgi:hypothetical protein
MRIWVLQDVEVDLVQELLVAERAALEFVINEESDWMDAEEIAEVAERLDAVRALSERMEEN